MIGLVLGRIVLRACGNFHYDLIELRTDGTFFKQTQVKLKDTSTRRLDSSRHYELPSSDWWRDTEWRSAGEPEFTVTLNGWNRIRQGRGYSAMTIEEIKAKYADLGNTEREVLR